MPKTVYAGTPQESISRRLRDWMLWEDSELIDVNYNFNSFDELIERKNDRTEVWCDWRHKDGHALSEASKYYELIMASNEARQKKLKFTIGRKTNKQTEHNDIDTESEEH